MSDLEYRDIAGQTISVGDYIVYSAAAGRSAVMKMGEVVALGERKDTWDSRKPSTPTLRVVSVDPWMADAGWSWRTGLQNGGKPVTLGMLDRVLVVTKVPALAAKFKTIRNNALAKIAAQPWRLG